MTDTDLIKSLEVSQEWVTRERDRLLASLEQCKKSMDANNVATLVGNVGMFCEATGYLVTTLATAYNDAAVSLAKANNDIKRYNLLVKTVRGMKKSRIYDSRYHRH